jgi:hypothetical protein
MLGRFIIPTAFVLTMACATVFNFSSCSKDEAPLPDCFDSALKAQHENDFCTMEWRGVKGCDGKLYGNECQANAQGIRIVP